MPKIGFHKLAALAVFVAAAAWIATGEFSSVGSAVTQDEPRPSEPTPVVEAAPARTVAVVTPPRQRHARAIRISGVTEANKRSRLAARSNGVIDGIPVEEGSIVAKDDLILTLDVEEKPAAVAMAEALLRQREAEAEAAERLIRSGSMPKLQAENVKAALSAAQSQLATAKAELERSEVRAPFDGIVDKVDVEAGSAIMQGAEIATILSLDPILAVGEVSEHDLSQLDLGNAAQIRLVDGRQVDGTIRYLSRDASAQTRTYRVEVSVANPGLGIPAGMTAEIILRADETEAVVLPRSVVTLSKRGDIGVRIVEPDNTVAFVPIDVIDDTPNGLVLGGIPDDARIIVAGQDLVAEGARVNPVPADQEVIERLVGEATGSTN